ncbi:MAG: type IV-A pilus assembly ATPase PilB [Bdellovibrionales bacterium]|nr:type IV-A pilus assembly ATPase PilB [Bdellovibrionales bacterium]
MAAKKGIGELLVRENLIEIDQLEEARKDQKRNGGRLTSALVRMGYVKDADLVEFLGAQYNVPTIDLRHFEIDPEAIKLVSKQICEKHSIIPVSKAGKSLVVAFSDLTNMIYVKDDLSLITRCKIEVVVASDVAIATAIEKYYDSGAKFDNIMHEMEDSEEAFEVAPGSQAEIVDNETGADDGPIIKFVNMMLAEAIKTKTSDIHVEPYEKRFRVRFRIDGRLVEKVQPPPGTANAITSRLKILSKMDISERRKPQDGRLKVRLKSGKEVDFRVNCTPVMFGEKVVLRLLDKSNLQVDLTKLGFDESQMKMFTEALKTPQGMILITGPTGSGKTTTIYSGLAELNNPGKNVSTAEDPVEFNLDGINQVQVNPLIGFTFADALRAFLRQDPEAIMVGEIRDLETASVAYKAASTGHLVVSTLHTNDASATVARLVDMGVEPYVVAEGTTLIIAQRLIRKVCPTCITDHKVPDEVLLDMGVAEDKLHEYTNIKRGEGCNDCQGTGTRGRVAIFEVMPFNAKVRESIIRGATPLEMKRAAVFEAGMITLRQSALLKLRDGQTTAEEVMHGSIKDDL